MLIHELPSGAKLALGSVADCDMQWVKVSDACDFFLASGADRHAFDVPERNNTNRSRQRHGNNFFPESNIFQWLNATGTNWYHPTHQYDAEPYYFVDEGFLSRFSPAELDILEDREITVAVPLGSRSEFGKTFKVNCKVCLPAASELGYTEDDMSVEGEIMPALVDFAGSLRYQSFATRTGVKGGGHIISYIGSYPDIATANLREAIRPMIRLKRDVEISGFDNGCYYIEDTNFMKACLDFISHF